MLRSRQSVHPLTITVALASLLQYDTIVPLIIPTDRPEQTV